MATENKLLAGPALGFLGGFTVLVFAAYEIYLGVNDPGIGSVGGIPIFNGSFLVGSGVFGIVIGLLLMLFAVALAYFPQDHFGLGVVLLFLSVLSLVSFGGGDGFGFLLGVLGGTCGLVYGPDVRRAPRPATQVTASDRTHRACPQCGTRVPIDAAFCTTCGSRLLPLPGSGAGPPPPTEPAR